MNQLLEILAVLSAWSAGFFVVLQYVGKKIIDRTFERDKIRFKGEIDKELKLFDASLNEAAIKYQVQFSNIHVNTASIIAELYKLIINLEYSVGDYMRNNGKPDFSVKMYDDLKALKRRHYETDIYFSDELNAKFMAIINAFVDVTGRVKSLESFIEKAERKRYHNPFVENEDFCGIRVIVYYQKDIEAIQEIIRTEFDLQESFDKVDDLDANEFGYRSKHSIVKIKRDWLTSPNFRHLDDIKIEIQVRTILMHAWAEIEHKLAYKSQSQISKSTRRELAIISALLESADKNFQQLRDNIENYKDDIKLELTVNNKISDTKDLNIDSLTALLDFHLPRFPNNRSNAIKVLERLLADSYTLSKVEELLKKIQPYVEKLNSEVFPVRNLTLTQGTILGYAIDIFDGYNKDTTVAYSEKRKQIVEKLRDYIRDQTKPK